MANEKNDKKKEVVNAIEAYAEYRYNCGYEDAKRDLEEEHKKVIDGMDAKLKQLKEIALTKIDEIMEA